MTTKCNDKETENILKVVDNTKRVELTATERDDFYYRTYKLGIYQKKIKTVGDLAIHLGMNEKTLSRYINAGRARAEK